jgi:hypothetical protein
VKLCAVISQKTVVLKFAIVLVIIEMWWYPRTVVILDLYRRLPDPVLNPTWQ